MAAGGARRSDLSLRQLSPNPRAHPPRFRQIAPQTENRAPTPPWPRPHTLSPPARSAPAPCSSRHSDPDTPFDISVGSAYLASLRQTRFRLGAIPRIAAPLPVPPPAVP